MKPAKAAINLLPQDDLRRKPVGQALKWSLTWARVIIVIVLVICITLYAVNFVLSIQEGNLSSDIATKRQQIEKEAAKEKEIRQAQDRIEAVKQLFDRRVSYTNFLNYLDQQKSEGINLNAVKISPPQVEISGTAENEMQYREFETKLVNAPAEKINNVVTGNLTKNTGESNKAIVTFNMSLTLGQDAFKEPKN